MKKTAVLKKRIFFYPVLFVLGILYSLPEFLITGIQQFPYHDGSFHLSRILGLGNVLQSPVSFLNFHHNGLMMNLCYPWLTMYPAYVFYKLTGSCITAYKMFNCFLTVLTLFLAFDVMREISENRVSAFCFSVLYAYCSYRFATVFNRAALGEVIAMTVWLPVFLGIYHVFFGEEEKWGYLAAGMALFSYTHNLSLMIASVIIGLMAFVTVWFWDQRKKRIFALVKAAAAAAVLSLGSLVPMFRLFRTDELSVPGGSGEWLAESVYDVKTMLLKCLRNEPTFHTVGLLVIAAFFSLCVFYLIRIIRGTSGKTDKGMNFIAFFGVLILFAVTDLLPWKAIADRTFLHRMQFAWRFNVCSVLFILAAFSYYLPQMIPSEKAELTAAVLICFLAVGLHLSSRLELFRADSSRILESDVASGEIVSMDYAPLRAREYRSEKGLAALEGILKAGSNDPVPADVSISGNGSVYTAVINLPESPEGTQMIDLPVFWYTTQDCTLNGEKITTSMSERGGTLAMVPSGRTAEIRISYRYTVPARISQAVSAAAAVFFVLLLIRRRGKTASA